MGLAAVGLAAAAALEEDWVTAAAASEAGWVGGAAAVETAQVQEVDWGAAVGSADAVVDLGALDDLEAQAALVAARAEEGLVAVVVVGAAAAEQRAWDWGAVAGTVEVRCG